MKISANPGWSFNFSPPRFQAHAITSLRGKPSSAYLAAGSSTSAIGRRPNFLCNSNQPSTHPGTVIGKGPVAGMVLRERRSNSSMVSDCGDRPLAFKPCSFPVSASQTMANKSPPMPQPVGSISPNAAFAAMAASTALPPRRKMSMAICVANGWLVATIPCFAITSLLVPKARPVRRSSAHRNEGKLARTIRIPNTSILRRKHSSWLIEKRHRIDANRSDLQGG